MVRIVAHRGNRQHAPENTRNALISAWVAGADVLEFDLQLTKDGHLVVSHDPTVDRLTKATGRIIDFTLAELRDLGRFNFAAKFSIGGATPRYRAGIETFEELLDLLPRTAPLLVELKHDSSESTGRREEFVGKAVRAVLDRGHADRIVFYSADKLNVRLVRRLAPGIAAVAFDFRLPPKEQIALAEQEGVDGLLTSVAMVLGADGKITEEGRRLEALFRSRKLKLGALLYPHPDGVLTAAQFAALRDHDWIWSVSTDSVLQAAPFARPGWTWIDEKFAGRTIDTTTWALGYAKAGKFCHVFQDDGVIVDIQPYPDELLPRRQADAVKQRLLELELDIRDVSKTWPYYSGGGVGLVRPLAGDFSAEVDYEVNVVGQATTLEMAVLNVDPGAHQPPFKADGTPKLPLSFRDKDSFYDPHGAPPYVGAEHDEDDGFRINWNLGTEYDSNQYGRPAGNGKAKSGRLRLDRRGAYFAAYYRNGTDAPDWVCVGTVRNDSLNPTLHLRCVGKRWRQELETAPGGFDPFDPANYHPILANRFKFSNLRIVRFGA